MATRLRAERVKLDRGGYDRGGRYWGTGQPLYRVESETPVRGGAFGTVDLSERPEYVRASSAAEARQKVRIKYGLAQAPMSDGRRLAQRLQLRIRQEIDQPTGGLTTGTKATRALLRATERLAERLRPNNPGDRAWQYFDDDIAKVKDRLDPQFGRVTVSDLEYALFNLRTAAQMIEGAASRAGSGERDRGRARGRRGR
jgi:hypothetical protein